jgi:1-acyl-sn-glycerol-3-phosphate acyltransferase
MTRLFHKTIKYYFRYLISWIGTARFRITTSGHKDIFSSGCFVIVSNHSSMADTFIIDRATSCQPRVLVDKGLFQHWYFPILAWAFDVVVISKGRERVAIKKCVSSLRKGNSMLVYPEGRMSETGTMGSWHRGARVIAEKALVPIVPIAVINAHQAWPPSTYFPFKKKLHVVIGRPLTSKNLPNNDTISMAKTFIEKNLNNYRENGSS